MNEWSLHLPSWSNSYQINITLIQIFCRVFEKEEGLLPCFIFPLSIVFFTLRLGVNVNNFLKNAFSSLDDINLRESIYRITSANYV